MIIRGGVVGFDLDVPTEVLLVVIYFPFSFEGAMLKRDKVNVEIYISGIEDQNKRLDSK